MSPQDVSCGFCGQVPGFPCVKRSGYFREPHRQRVRYFMSLAPSPRPAPPVRKGRRRG